MIFDLLTSPQGHQLDRRLKISLAYCSTDHPRQFDMTHNHVKKKQDQTLLWTCVASAHLQCVNNHYAKFEYKGMKSV